MGGGKSADARENLQILLPSQGRAINLVRLAGPLATMESLVMEATICLDPADRSRADSANQLRLKGRFRRGGWLGPKLGGMQPQLLRRFQQSLPAWLSQQQAPAPAMGVE
jgi:hypothetical protein